MRLRPLPPSEQTPEQHALHDAVVQGPRGARPGIRLLADDGSLRGPFDAMLRNPAVGLPLQAVGAALRFETGLRSDLREFAILLVAVRWHCEFEWFEHEPIARAAGVPEHLLASLSFEATCDDIDDDYSALETFVRELFPHGQVTDAAFERLRERIGESQVFEVIALAGYYSALAMILNVLGTPAEPVPDGVTLPQWATRTRVAAAS